MISIEDISNNIGRKIAYNLHLSKEREEIIAYGALSLLHTLQATVLLIIFGLIFNSVIEILCIAVTAALLRRYSGGAHASSPGRCSAITVITFGFLSLLVKYINISPSNVLVYQLITILFILYSFYNNCPVDTPNKPINDEEQKNKLRKKSFVFILFTFIIIFILWFLFIRYEREELMKIIIAVHTGILWQSFLLTYPGRGIIKGLDCYLKNLFKGG